MKIRNCLFIIGLLVFGAPAALAAELRLEPASSTVTRGEPTVFNLIIAPSSGESINAFEVKIQLAKNISQPLVIPAEDSAVVWVARPAFEPETGLLTATGGFIEPVSEPRTIFRVIVSVSSGSGAAFNIQKDSRVLAADGQGTPLNVVFKNASISVRSAGSYLSSLTSPSNPDQTRWSTKRTVELNWVAGPGSRYSYALTPVDLYKPIDTQAEDSVGKITYDSLADGVYVFAIRERDAQGQWGPAAKRYALIDATPPEPFEVKTNENEGSGFLVFQTYDKMSGVAGYDVMAGDAGAFGPAESPYPVKGARGNFIIRARDQAGNERRVEVSLAPAAPAPVGLVIVLLLIALVGWRGKMKRKIF